MPSMANIDMLTDEWVKKLHFENRVDFNLQIPASGESLKVQVGDIPPEHLPQLGFPSLGSQEKDTSQAKANPLKARNTISSLIPTNDSYLSSIVSSPTVIATAPSPNTNNSSGSCQDTPDCLCYKCQRQRRRAGTRGRAILTEPTILKQQQQQQQQQLSLSTLPESPIKEPITSSSPVTVYEEPASSNTTTITTTTITKPTMTRNGSFVLRKKPSIVSYEKHLPRPTYSELDSIYRSRKERQNDDKQENRSQHNDLQKYTKDSYEISWKDETGDDILTSLRTFQTIFDEKPHGSEGLSDLLEVRAQELRLQKIQQKEQQALAQQQQQIEPNRPPKRSDCLTLGYRDGPHHKHLTLYHTMKMRGPKERMTAYGKAFQHCIRADSGLASWIEKQTNQPAPNTTIHHSRQQLSLRKSTKRSILQLPGRKQKATAEDLWLRTSKLTDSPSTQRDLTVNDNAIIPIDVLSTANALMPTPSSVTLNSPMSRTNTNNKPYDYVDMPGRPLPRNRNSVDKESLTSMDMEHGRNIKSGKLWSSLGRKSSRSRSTTPSIHSVEKVYQPPVAIQETSEPFEKALDDLCQIVTHVDRSVLKTYLEQTNGDYMKTLSVIRAEVTSGRL